MKKLFFVSFLLIFIIFSGCNENITPMCATFNNQTLPNSENYVVGIKFSEDERVKDEYYDVFVMANVDNLILNFGKELHEQKEVSLTKKGEWVSVANLLNYDLTTFENAINITYIFSTNKKCVLSFKVCGGEVADSVLVNKKDVSKVFEIKLLKTIQNT